MSTPRYLCRIQITDIDPSKKRLDTRSAEILYTDKKLFTFGSGSEADFRFKGPGVDSLHFAMKSDGPTLFIKSLGKGKTQVSSYAVPHDKVTPYKPGEAIRLGDAKQVIQIQLFRQFVEAHEESEAIIREAWEKTKEIESAAVNQQQNLALEFKQFENLKAETAKRVADLLEHAKHEAEGIKQAALQTQDQILEKAEQAAALTIQNGEKETERVLLAIKLKDEENTRKVLDQAREKAKEIKLEAEREYEDLLKSGQREAELVIAGANSRVAEFQNLGEKENRALLDDQNRILKEISETEKSRQAVIEKLASTKAELKAFADQKYDAQRDFEKEKERLRLNLEELEKQVDLRQRDKRALDSDVTSGTQHLQEMKTEADVAKRQAELANVQVKAAKAGLADCQLKIKELNVELEKLRGEQTTVSEHLRTLKEKETQELEILREKMGAEYEKRKTLEQEWFAKERMNEQAQASKEHAAKAKLEGERLPAQAKAISGKILPLILTELAMQMEKHQITAFKPQLEKIVEPIVLRAVKEEYEFRRENWGNIRPYNFLAERFQRVRVAKVNFGLAALAVLFLVAAVLAAWPNLLGSQTSNMSSRAPNSPASKE